MQCWCGCCCCDVDSLRGADISVNNYTCMQSSLGPAAVCAERVSQRARLHLIPLRCFDGSFVLAVTALVALRAAE